MSELVNQLRDALLANQVFHTPIALRRRGGEWDEYEIDAIKRTREGLAAPTPDDTGKVLLAKEREEPASEAWSELKVYINSTPELISLLYDLDLLPEQLKKKTLDFNRMLIISTFHRRKFSGTKGMTHGEKIRFLDNLDEKIEYHRENQHDPHGISIAVMVSLEETRRAFAKAVEENHPEDLNPPAV